MAGRWFLGATFVFTATGANALELQFYVAFLYGMAAHYHSEKRTLESHPAMPKALAFMEQHFAEPIALEDIVCSVHLGARCVRM